MKIEPFTSFDDVKPNPVFHLRNGAFIGGIGVSKDIAPAYQYRILSLCYTRKGRYSEHRDHGLDIIGVSYENLKTKEME